MTQGKRKTWVIGHKNPDTDSICAAIAYADLKNQTEDGIFIPKRAGHMNEETKYVLKFFDVPEPELVTAVGAGTTTITATCGEKTATCKVTVNASPLQEVRLDNSKMEILK